MVLRMLPDADGGRTVFRDAVFGDKATIDGEGPDRRRQVAAIAAPVDKGLVDGDLAKQVVHIVIRLGGRCQDDGFTGTGRGSPHTVDLFLVWVRAADDPKQEFVPGLAWGLAGFREVL